MTERKQSITIWVIVILFNLIVWSLLADVAFSRTRPPAIDPNTIPGGGINDPNCDILIFESGQVGVLYTKDFNVHVSRDVALDVIVSYGTVSRLGKEVDPNGVATHTWRLSLTMPSEPQVILVDVRAVLPEFAQVGDCRTFVLEVKEPPPDVIIYVQNVVGNPIIYTDGATMDMLSYDWQRYRKIVQPMPSEQANNLLMGYKDQVPEYVVIP